MAENKLPGFGLPRNHMPGNARKFPNALDYRGLGWLSQGTMYRERRMLAFIGQITDKPDWQTKVHDETIVEKWRAEAKAQPNVELDDVFMSDAMFDYCIAELKDKAVKSEKAGYVKVLDAELAVTKSDTAVSDDLAAELRKFVAALEDVPEADKDWHPGSDNKVLDLLHPSLFPVVFGLTKALREGKVPLDKCIEYTGKGDIVPVEVEEKKPPVETFSWMPQRPERKYMDDYQWLPSDVELSDAGAKITSYINNLHPDKHPELYGVLEKFVDAAIPLWEECLSSFKDERRYRIDRTDDDDDYYIPEGLVFPIPRSSGNGNHGDGEGSDPDSDGEAHSDEDEEWRYSEEYQEWREEHRILKWPEPPAFVPVEERPPVEKQEDDEVLKVTPRVNLRSKDQYPEGLQVIFKLANIHLTPDGEVTVEGDIKQDDSDKEESDNEESSGSETSKYYGGSWHVEGTLSERICATAIYYYDEENITPSSLAFRTSINDEVTIMIPAQGAFNSLEAYYGIEQEEPTVVKLGSVLTRPGRLLAFPNVLQHRVGSFKLRDPTKPGHRKILAMFLIDPSRRVLSTAHVPPQRKDWWAEKVFEQKGVQSGNLMDKLPNELFNQTMDMVEGFPISWDEAVKIREDLMLKRGRYVEEQNEEVYGATFNFCEH